MNVLVPSFLRDSQMSILYKTSLSSVGKIRGLNVRRPVGGDKSDGNQFIIVGGTLDACRMLGYVGSKKLGAAALVT